MRPFLFLCLAVFCIAKRGMAKVVIPQQQRQQNRSLPTLLSSSFSSTLRDTSPLDIRGGGLFRRTPDLCQDSDQTLALRAGFSVLGETFGLLAVLKGGQVLGNTEILSQFQLGGLPLVQWLSFVLIIFNASAIKNIVDGSISIANSQVLKPNVVPGDPSWYSSLQKPWFNPPGWLFPIMWVLISKPTQLVAVQHLWKTAVGANSKVPYFPQLALYCAHLSLGDVWNQIFFGCQRIRLGFYTIGTFYSTLVASAVLFARIDRTAGLFLLPTIGWVTVATLLNLEIDRLNTPK